MKDRILIAGAGSTGLTLAIELRRRGFTPVIIDQKEGPSPLSRAIGINPRSLHLLEESGVTERLLAKGLKVMALEVKEGHKSIAGIDTSNLPPPYSFMLALPQDETEAILIERLRELGVEVRWNTRLTDVRQGHDSVEAVLEFLPKEEYDYVVGCDGVRSAVRNAESIAFEGHDYARPWSVADMKLSNGPQPPNRAVLDARDDGLAIVFIPLDGQGRYRVVTTHPGVETIMKPFGIVEIAEQADFYNHIRQAAHYRKARVFLAGDAAHTHSPAGGRGMNLGIEDACVLARCFAENKLDEYEKLRHPVAKKVLKLSERLARMITIRSPFWRFIRNTVLRIVQMSPDLQKIILRRIVSGIEG